MNLFVIILQIFFLLSCSASREKQPEKVTGAVGGDAATSSDASVETPVPEESKAFSQGVLNTQKGRPEPPPISECLDWKPKKLLEDVDAILRDIKDKPTAELKTVKCFEKIKVKKKGAEGECQSHECLAWVEYWLDDGKWLYSQLDVDGAMSNFLKAAKLARQCGIGGETASIIFLNLGIALIESYGEILKGSLAFKWAILFKWDIALPDTSPPNVKKTFEVIKGSMGNEPFTCSMQ